MRASKLKGHFITSEVADTIEQGWAGRVKALSAAEGLEMSHCYGQ
jgi:hypothetical protein